MKNKRLKLIADILIFSLLTILFIIFLYFVFTS